MARELPYLLGARRDTDAEAIELSARALALWVCASLTAAAVGVALRLGDALPIAVAFVLSLAILFHVDQFAHRSRLAFRTAGIQQVLFALGLVIAGGWVISLHDPSVTHIVLAYGAALLVGVGMYYRVHRPWRVELAVLRQLAGIGFPIMLAGLGYALLTTADRWIAAIYLPPPNAGSYGLASVIAASVVIASTVISQQTYPRMAMAYGSGAERHELRQMANRQSVTAVFAVAVLSGLMVVVAALAIPPLLPAYVDSVPAIVILCIGLIAMSGSAGLGNYLNVVGAHWLYLSMQAAAIALGILCMVVGALLQGIHGIAVGLAVTLAVYSCLLLVATRIYDRRYFEGRPPRSGIGIHSG
jgi:O-antigen/teichoic acid export membrane protein